VARNLNFSFFTERLKIEQYQAGARHELASPIFIYVVSNISSHKKFFVEVLEKV